jgi:hypothetical protein
MTSQRQIEANRRNAKRSTGPKTLAGKAAVKKNALKHGLTSANVAVESEFVEHLMTSLAEGDQSERARVIATATEIIMRVRQLCDQKLLAAFTGGEPLEPALKDVARLRRYEKRAISKRRKAMEQGGAAKAPADQKGGPAVS